MRQKRPALSLHLFQTLTLWLPVVVLLGARWNLYNAAKLLSYKRSTRLICPLPQAVSLFCTKSLANRAQETDNSRLRTVINWSVPWKIRFPRCIITDLVLALCHRSIKTRRAKPFSVSESHFHSEQSATWRIG